MEELLRARLRMPEDDDFRRREPPMRSREDDARVAVTVTDAVGGEVCHVAPPLDNALAAPMPCCSVHCVVSCTIDAGKSDEWGCAKG